MRSLRSPRVYAWEVVTTAKIDLCKERFFGSHSAHWAWWRI